MIRVGLEVSFAAGQPGQPSSVTGIGRVIKELVSRMSTHASLDIHCVGCFGGDWNPIATDEQTSRWVRQELGGVPPFQRCHHSRTGLSSRFASRFTDWSSKASANRNSGHPILYKSISLLRWLCRIVLEADTRPAIDIHNTDVFVATFRPLPDWLATEIPCAIFIFDVYPARFPQEAGSDVHGMLDRVVRSIVPTRDIVVVNSLFTRSDFCELTGFPPERVHVAYLAADQRFTPVTDPHALARVRQAYRIGDQPYCLSVANPQPRKDLNTTIRAFAAAARMLPDWKGRLVMAGNTKVGWGYESLQSTIAEFPELAERILSIGTVAEEHLPSLYSGALGFIFPSRYEGFGLPVLEAMSCGVPVICSNATSLPEVGGNAPIYCAPGDVDAFARAIKSLVCDPICCQKMREAGLRQADRFSWTQTADRVREAILHASGRPIRMLSNVEIGNSDIASARRKNHV